MPRSLIGLDASLEQHLAKISDSDVVKLLYREHLVLKHSSKKRLAKEIEDKMPPEVLPHRMPIVAAPSANDSLAKLLVKYLCEAGWSARKFVLFFSTGGQINR